MVRMLPKHEIGIWVLFTSVTAILEMIRNGFIRNPFVALLVDAEEEDRPDITTASLTLHGILAGSMSILLLASAGVLERFWDAPGIQSLFYIYALNSIIFIPFLHFEYVQMSRSNFRAIAIANFARLGITTAYIIVIYFAGRTITLVGLAVVQLIATLLASGLAWYMARDWITRPARPRWPLVRELFHFGKYTFGTNISSMFVKSTDSWMIGRFISTAGVALYNPAIRIANLVEVPTLAIATVVFPQLPQKMKESGEQGVRDIYTRSVSLILAAMLPVTAIFYFLAEEVITLVFGVEYADAAPILRVTVFYTLLIPFNRQFGTVMDSLKKPKINFYLLVMVAVLNVFFNYIFLHLFGIIGSAYGTLLSYCIVFVVNQIILYNMYGISTLKVFESIPWWYRVGWNFFRERIIKLAW